MPQWIIVQSGAPSVADKLPILSRPTRLAIACRFWVHQHAFSADGQFAFEVPDPPRLNWLQVAAAHVFYNPCQTIDGTWKRKGIFDSDALIGLVERGLENDDDIIQQWFNADDVLRLLRTAMGFDEMLIAVDAINGGHEMRPETREFVNRVLRSNR